MKKSLFRVIQVFYYLIPCFVGKIFFLLQDDGSTAILFFSVVCVILSLTGLLLQWRKNNDGEVKKISPIFFARCIKNFGCICIACGFWGFFYHSFILMGILELRAVPYYHFFSWIIYTGLMIVGFGGVKLKSWSRTGFFLLCVSSFILALRAMSSLIVSLSFKTVGVFLLSDFFSVFGLWFWFIGGLFLLDQRVVRVFQLDLSTDQIYYVHSVAKNKVLRKYIRVIGFVFFLLFFTGVAVIVNHVDVHNIVRVWDNRPALNKRVISEEDVLIGDFSTYRYHKLQCRKTSEILEESIHFMADEDEAKHLGLYPCSICLLKKYK